MRLVVMFAAVMGLAAACAAPQGTLAERLARAGQALEGPAVSAPVARETCLEKTGDVLSGSNRICTYRCPSGHVSTTISAASMCPISLER